MRTSRIVVVTIKKAITKIVVGTTGISRIAVGTLRTCRIVIGTTGTSIIVVVALRIVLTISPGLSSSTLAPIVVTTVSRVV